MNSNAYAVPPNTRWNGQWNPNKQTPNVTDEIWEYLSDDEKHLVNKNKQATKTAYKNRKKQDELMIHLLTIFEYYKTIPRGYISTAVKKVLDLKFPNKEDEETIKENYEHELALANIAKNNFLITKNQLQGKANLIGDLSKKD